MNRAQLNALLAAHLITPDQHHNALATIDQRDRVTVKPALQLELAADNVQTSEESRTITGIVSVYETYITSHGMILHTGCLQPRMPLNRVKLLRDHNHSDPLGFATAFNPDTLEASFVVPEGENGDRALSEASNGLRDGMSVGFTVTDYDLDDDWTLHVNAAEFYETSLCAIPAIPDAGVTNVAAALATHRKDNRTMKTKAELAAALTAGTITQEEHDTQLAAIVAAEALAVKPPVPAEVVAGPELQVSQPAALVVTDRSLSLAQVTERLAKAANTGNWSDFQLAIADVIPADDAGTAFLREDWEGEMWRDDKSSRPWVDAFGAPSDLKNMTGKGWEWGTADESGDGGEPLVDEYAGNKTEVPSNEIGTESKTFTAFRIAAGWDVDRVFVDFANEAFWSAFFPAAMRNYKVKSNASIRTRVLAKATAPTDTVTTGGALAVLKQLYRDVRPYGKANRVMLGDDLYDEFCDLKTDQLPIWLKLAAVGVDLAEGTADIGTLHILNDSSLAATQAVAIDSRAAIVRERSPFRLEAQNIPKGGVDVGIFSYLRFDDHENRAIVKRTYVEES